MALCFIDQMTNIKLQNLKNEFMIFLPYMKQASNKNRTNELSMWASSKSTQQFKPIANSPHK